MIQKEEEKYWSEYYKAGAAPDEPSLFAKEVVAIHANPGDSLMELGCGNGRDAHYFAANRIEVVAIDQCASEIEKLIETNGRYKNLHYESGDFTELKDSDKKFDLVYSRFTLHSVSASGQKNTLEWCHRNLKNGGKLCIETRGQKNELYRKGEPVPGEKDAYTYNNHYRRFVDYEAFIDEITKIGFKIKEGSEETGFAPFEDTDYHFIRIIAQK